MADVLSAKIQVTAPGVQQAFEGVAKGAISTEKALHKLAPAQKAANTALIDFGRIVQDAPYAVLSGNISAVANNFDPLILSFKRAKEAAGSTSGALKAMAGSLVGVGGIGLAVSLVSSALVLFGDRLFGSKKELTEHKEAITPVVTEYDRFEASLEKIVNSLGKEAGQFAILSRSVLDATLPLQTRGLIIDELKDKYPEYLGNLNKESELYDRLANSITTSVKNLAVQSELKALMGAMGDDFERAVKFQIELNQLRRNQIPGGFLAMDDADFKAEEKRLEGAIRGITNQLKLGKDQLSKVAGGAQSLIDFLFPDLGKGKDKEKKVKAEYDALKAIFKDLLSIREIFSAQINKELQKLAETSKKIFGSRFAIQIDLEPDKSKNISASLDREIKRLTERNPVIELRIKRAKEGEKAFEQLKKEVENTADVVGNILGPAFDAVFDTIREGGNVLKAFVAGIGQAVLQLVQRLISAAALAAVIAALTGGKGGFSFLALFKSFAGFRAGGGPVQAGRSYIVGENGPELFRPNTGGSIVSNNNLMTGGKVAGGMSFEVVGTNIIRGQDIVTIFHAVNRSQGRLT